MDVPGYFEFRLGDYQHELGVIDRKYAPSIQEHPAGPITYWQVDDVKAAFNTLISIGATQYEPIIVRGDGTKGFVTASVVDLFGNILGIMTNPHYLEILHSKNSSI